MRKDNFSGFWRRVRRWFSPVWGVILLAFCADLGAQGADSPAFKQLRYEENYAYLRDPGKRSDPLDRIKFIPLNSAASSYLTLGGEIRERYERYHNTSWGMGPQDSTGYLLERYMAHADVHLGEGVRFFAQLKSGLEEGRNGGPRPTDKDELDVHQAFIDVGMTVGHAEKITFRVGRQELAYGSSRLISVREGPNVRSSFDGAKVIVKIRDWQIDGFATRPVRTSVGLFNDSTDSQQAFWAVYAVKPVGWLPKGKVDLYYLGLETDTARFDQGTAREVRHTIGTRLSGDKSGWDYNYEFVYQFGTFGHGRINAWTVATETGYAFENLPLQPRFGVRTDITSGDRDPASPVLQTFKPLFPRGSYFGEPALIGPANHVDLHPQVDLQVHKRVTVTVDWDCFWRESTRDGIYGPAANLIRSGQTSNARSVGQQSELLVQWAPDRHFAVSADFAYFRSGRFLRETTPGKPLGYVSTWLTYKF